MFGLFIEVWVPYFCSPERRRRSSESGAGIQWNAAGCPSTGEGSSTTIISDGQAAEFRSNLKAASCRLAGRYRGTGQAFWTLSWLWFLLLCVHYHVSGSAQVCCAVWTFPWADVGHVTSLNGTWCTESELLRANQCNGNQSKKSCTAVLFAFFSSVKASVTFTFNLEYILISVRLLFYTASSKFIKMQILFIVLEWCICLKALKPIMLNVCWHSVNIITGAWLMNIRRGTRDCGVILMLGNGEILLQSHWLTLCSV